MAQGQIHISRYRPVQIEEYLVFDNRVYPASTLSSFYNTATQLKSSAQEPTKPTPEPTRVIKPSQHKEFSNFFG